MVLYVAHIQKARNLIRITMLCNCGKCCFRVYFHVFSLAFSIEYSLACILFGAGSVSIVEEALAIVVGHLAPDLDCITAIWILMRFGELDQAELHFVPSGSTLHHQPVDSNPHIIHVDTGGGRYDHHQRKQGSLSAAELVRRATAPYDLALQRLVHHVTAIDHAREKLSDGLFNIQALVNGLNQNFPDQPALVVQTMLPNMDAWYAHEARQIRLEAAFQQRIEFQTAWGLGVALESADGGSSRLAFQHGAVLHVYRDQHGWMGAAAKSQSPVDFSEVYTKLQHRDAGADWYLHPNRRLLLCGSAKSPPQQASRLSLEEFVQIIADSR